jgi:hypothetical protein
MFGSVICKELGANNESLENENHQSSFQNNCDFTDSNGFSFFCINRVE